jgi:hypothetical protein
MRWNSFVFAVLLVSVVMLSGCKSRYIETTVHNDTGQTASLLEVDYPSASFGKDALAAGADFHYRFKIIGDGPMKVIWTDAEKQTHTVKGPVLHEGYEGSLLITLEPKTAEWNLKLVAK